MASRELLGVSSRRRDRQAKIKRGTGSAVPRPVIAILAVAAVLMSLLSWAAPSQARSAAPHSSPAAAPGDKLAPGLQRKFERSGGEPQDFWILFGDRADTSGAQRIEDWADRGQYVVDRLRRTAHAAQANTVARLKAAGVDYTAYWVVDAIRVEHGSLPLAATLSGDPDVDRLIAPVRYEQVDPVRERLTSSKLSANATASVEWGVQNINADQVWQQYGVRGDGITVASIDTGVQFDHPALVDSYRGNNGDGTFTNDYNWLDVTGQSSFPTDDQGHGTHTMGTMVGDDHGANQVGVAPGVTWIEANGCATCADDDLMASAQWMLAPTKLDGTDPDPAMRPDIINNSWGSQEPSTDPFLEDIQTAWADAGIFGVWANGNNGPDCNTAGSPGSRTLNYSVGAYDQTNAIASFSSRGPGQDGEIKPNIAAPGVSVRSSVPGNQYGLMDGTSMATPHVAGAVALLWAADPALIGDIAATRQLLDDTAVDTPDAQCGGTDDDNNVFGEGRLDALALVQATSPAATGTITGTITDAESGTPIGGAVLRLAAGDLLRSARGAEDGTYNANVAAGDYQATVTAFGFETATVDIGVVAGQTTTTDIQLTPVEGFDVTGQVIDQRTGHGIPGATVTITGSRFAATTDTDGSFTLANIPGPKTYTITIDGGGCSQHDVFRTVTVTGDIALPAVELPRRTDEPVDSGWGWGPPYGYSCLLEPAHWIAGDTPVDKPDLDHSTSIEMPFGFTYFGVRYRTLYASWGRGLGADFSFWRDNGSLEWHLPSGLWAWGGPMTVDDQTQLLTRTRGTAPNRAFTIEFQDVTNLAGTIRFSFEVTLHEDGDIVFAYKDLAPDNLFERGAQSVVMINDHSPDGRSSDRTTFLYSSLQSVLSSDWQIHFSLPPNGFVRGTVLDRATNKPVAGATVNAYDRNGTRVPVRTLTDADGRYRIQLFTGKRYQIEVLKPPGYDTPPRQTVRLSSDRQVVDLKTELHAGRTVVKPASQSVRPAKPATAQLTNAGDRPLRWRASAYVPDPDAPAPGTELSSTRLADSLVLLGVEEVDGSYWIAQLNTSAAFQVAQFAASGEPTGSSIDMVAVADALGVPADGLVPWDMAWIGSRGWLCLSFLTANDIVCVDPARGDITMVIPTGFGADSIVQGLAYDPDGDRFFVSAAHINGGFQRRIRTIAGIDRPDPGHTLNTCTYTRQGEGLAWNPTARLLWTATSTGGAVSADVGVTYQEVDPATCAEVASVPTEGVGKIGDLDPSGDFVAFDQLGATVSTTRSPDRIGQHLRWLSMSAISGTLKPGGAQKLTVTIKWASVPENVTQVRVKLRGNGGARSKVTIPITLRR